MRRMILIAHESKLNDMIEWVRSRRRELSEVEIHATRSTGEKVAEVTGLPVKLLPDGGDDAVREMIENGLVDMVLFLWHPRSPQPHEIDVEALLRLTYLHDVPTALNTWTADFFFSSLRKGARGIGAGSQYAEWPAFRTGLRLRRL